MRTCRPEQPSTLTAVTQTEKVLETCQEKFLVPPQRTGSPLSLLLETEYVSGAGLPACRVTLGKWLNHTVPHL